MRNRTETVSADRLLRCFAVLCCTTSVAMAGPNAGGVLLVHDTGVAFSSDTALPPVTPLPPSAR